LSKNFRTIRAAACTLLLAASGGAASAEEAQWQHTLVFYGMGAAIDGQTQIGDLTVPVDVSISEVFDALEFGAMGAYRADNGTWSFTVDATYMGLGGTSETDRGLVKGDVDIDQITLMGTAGRRWTDNLEALFSLAYFDLSTDLKVTTTAPVTGAVTVRTASVDASWVDPMLGLHYGRPFADEWRFNLRGDVGGFGIGSDFSYQVFANVHWQSSGGFGAVLGYRLIGFDHEDGRKGSPGYQRFDLTEQGPLLGITYTF
jgi:hypothetical protein